MPVIETIAEKTIPAEEILFDVDGNGPGNGGFDDPGNDPDGRPLPPVRPAGLYRSAVVLGIAWIGIFFATATIVLIDTRLNVKRWSSISIPHFSYLSTVVLLCSNWTMELARSWSGTAAVRNCTRWLRATVVLGVAFIASQTAAMKLAVDSNHIRSQTPIFFFYLFTGTHAFCVFAGVIALVGLTFAVRRWRRWRRKTALNTMALFWRFSGVLWLYTLGLLLLSVCR